MGDELISSNKSFQLSELEDASIARGPESEKLKLDDLIYSVSTLGMVLVFSGCERNERAPESARLHFKLLIPLNLNLGSVKVELELLDGAIDGSSANQVVNDTMKIWWPINKYSNQKVDVAIRLKDVEDIPNQEEYLSGFRVRLRFDQVNGSNEVAYFDFDRIPLFIGQRDRISMAHPPTANSNILNIEQPKLPNPENR